MKHATNVVNIGDAIAHAHHDLRVSNRLAGRNEFVGYYTEFKIQVLQGPHR